MAAGDGLDRFKRPSDVGLMIEALPLERAKLVEFGQPSVFDLRIAVPDIAREVVTTVGGLLDIRQRVCDQRTVVAETGLPLDRRAGVEFDSDERLGR